MNPASPRTNKPVHNGKNSQTAAAPAPNSAPKDAPRNRVTGVLANKVAATNLPMNRAKAIFAAANARKVASSMGSC